MSNPWFDDSPDSCWHCRFKKKVTEMSPNSTLGWREEWEVAVFRVIPITLTTSSIMEDTSLAQQ